MIKLQINNIKVFERLVDLIAPDEEAKLELKKQIIQEWSKTFIKGMLDDDMKKFIEDINNDLKSTWRSESLVKKEVQAIVDKRVEDMIRERDLTALIETSIERIIKSKFK